MVNDAGCCWSDSAHVAGVGAPIAADAGGDGHRVGVVARPASSRSQPGMVRDQHGRVVERRPDLLARRRAASAEPVTFIGRLLGLRRAVSDGTRRRRAGAQVEQLGRARSASR